MQNRTYRYLTPNMLYSFGYGLSYTTFKYRTLDVRPSVVHYGDMVNFDVYVQNEGQYDGEEVS